MLIKPKISILLFLIFLYIFGFAVCNCDSSVITIENYTDECECDCGDCDICDTDAYDILYFLPVVFYIPTPFDINLTQTFQCVSFFSDSDSAVTKGVYFIRLTRGPPKKLYNLHLNGSIA
jgi:hypothetical protein